MRKFVLCGLFLIGQTFGATWAVTISLSPASQDITVRETTLVDLVISELGAPPYLGAFDLDLTFSSGALDLASVTFGDSLGDPDVISYVNVDGTLVPDVFGAGDAVTGASFLTANTVGLFAISFLETDEAECVFCIPPFLEDLQSTNFVLASFRFTGIKSGTSTIGLSNVTLSDGSGNEIPDVVVQRGKISVVHEPNIIALTGLGLVGLIFSSRRKRTRI